MQFELTEEQQAVHKTARDFATNEVLPKAAEIDRVLKSMAAIVDALNPVRNRASGAHPNESVLQEPEAMLVINGVNTLLHYLDARLR